MIFLATPPIAIVEEYKVHELHLRNFKMDDVSDFMEWGGDDEVTKHLLWNSYKNHAEVEQFFREVVLKHPWFKAICVGQKVIGSIILDKGRGPFSAKAELGFALSRKYWGKGYATKAVLEALKKGFQDLDVKRIEVFVDPANSASIRVLEKCGFKKEGYLEKHTLHKGHLRDRVVFSVVHAS